MADNEDCDVDGRKHPTGTRKIGGPWEVGREGMEEAECEILRIMRRLSSYRTQPEVYYNFLPSLVAVEIRIY